MKFCKTYQGYMLGQERKELPAVGFKQLKKILKHCRRDLDSGGAGGADDGAIDQTSSDCRHQCPVCDGSFFPALMEEMDAIVGCFNNRVQQLLNIHLAKGFKKCYMWCKGKLEKHHANLMKEDHDLVTYAIINAIAIRKILKKYDKIHDSKQGREFKSQAQQKHIEILQSPWLCELMALHINLREKKVNKKKGTVLLEGCSLVTKDGKPSLTCELFDSVKLDIDLACAICLDTVFDPIALTCGHIFCYMCACSAASVTIVGGLKTASPKKKCPLCREDGPYEGAVHLEELNILLSHRCPEYWEQRRQSERAERLKQVKEHWENQS
ncbi:E3 ubiquitin-protein ligase NLA-like protein [Drosera capensis]